MKPASFAILPLMMAGIVGSASAQSFAGAANGVDSGDPAGYYDYGQVVRVAPVVVPRRNALATDPRCTTRDDGYGNDRYGGPDADGFYRTGPPSGSQAGRSVATIVGSVIGAVLGSQVGGGSVRYATSVIGSSVGGLAGQQVYDEAHRSRERASVTVCDPMATDQSYPGNNPYPGNDELLFDVTYLYGGRTYTTRTDHNPGERIRIRVDVNAE